MKKLLLLFLLFASCRADNGPCHVALSRLFYACEDAGIVAAGDKETYETWLYYCEMKWEEQPACQWTAREYLRCVSRVKITTASCVMPCPAEQSQWEYCVTISEPLDR